MGGVENHMSNTQLTRNSKTNQSHKQTETLQNNCEMVQLPNIINSTKMHLWLHVLGKVFFLDTAGSCTPRSPIIHHPCPVTPSISEAHINRKHSVVLTVEEGLCIHLSGYSAPLCHRCLDLPRNRWTSEEIGAK